MRIMYLLGFVAMGENSAGRLWMRTWGVAGRRGGDGGMAGYGSGFGGKMFAVIGLALGISAQEKI